jgi:hypothetical protein
MNTVKNAVKLHPSSDEKERKNLEQIEIQTLEKIVKSPNVVNQGQAPPANGGMNNQSTSGGIPGTGDGTGMNLDETALFDKLIQKLVEYNDKINDGKEMSVVEYLKRIDPMSTFMEEYDTQRAMRKSFIEEFRIHCFNYILLLFESIMRILTTLSKD